MGNAGNGHGFFAGGQFPQVGDAVFGDNDDTILRNGSRGRRNLTASVSAAREAVGVAAFDPT